MGYLNKSSRKGILTGIGLPSFFLAIVLLVFDANHQAIQTSAISGLAALCAIPNLLLFFRALRKNNDAYANGVLLGCILWALFTFGIKLIQ